MDCVAPIRWLQVFAVIRKRPYKVLHSYAEHRYTVVCDKERCPWRVCARKQNITGKWKIIKVVGPHNCADHELTVRHRQLTSTLIAKRMMGIFKKQSNMKVRTIIITVEKIYGGYVITYGKAWRAKQRAWRMIYGDLESGYKKQLSVLFNAIKAVNPGMHYEYISKPNAWKDGRQIFGRAFWCFPQCVEAFRHCHPVFSIDGTFLIGKYRGTLLIGLRLSSWLRRAATRCDCRTATTRDVHVPSPREGGVGSSRQGPSGSKAIVSEDEDDDDNDDDDDQRPEELGPSQLHDAPLTQPTQVVGTRLRHPRSPYTPGTDALGHKGKGKTRR
uniref:Uncharacterized protein n=1 Tax=Setaria italica TaxID=4555 RepID=K4A1I2_SETIT